MDRFDSRRRTAGCRNVAGPDAKQAAEGMTCVRSTFGVELDGGGIISSLNGTEPVAQTHDIRPRLVACFPAPRPPVAVRCRLGARSDQIENQFRPVRIRISGHNVPYIAGNSRMKFLSGLQYQIATSFLLGRRSHRTVERD